MNKLLLALLCVFMIPIKAQPFNTNIITEVNTEQPYSVIDMTPSGDLIKNVKLSNLRLGFVNFRRIMGTIPQLATIRSTLDEEFKAQQQSFQKAQDELTELEKKATQNHSETDYDSYAQQLIAKRREIAQQDAQFRDNYSVRRNEELAKLQNLVLDQIIGLAKEQGFDVILNDTGVIYVSEKADLTDLVIERLNKLATPNLKTSGTISSIQTNVSTKNTAIENQKDTQ